MNNRKSFVMFLLAGLFAVGAALFANEWIVNKFEGPEQVSEGMESVVVAAIDIDFGRRIDPAQLKILQMPRETIPHGAFRSVEEVKGKVALQNIYSGDILLTKKVREHLGGSTLAAVISPGMRAVTVRVNDVVGVAGFLLPGNRVDVIATRKDRASGGTVSKTLLRDVKVLAVDQTASPEKDKPTIVRAVTLELAPKDGERLVKATTEGSVQLALRNPVEEAVAEEEPEPVVEAPKIAANLPNPGPVGPDLGWITLIRGTKIEKSDVRP
jgi:pilus assembly protein CpaB